MTPDTSSLKPLADEATALLKALAHPVRLTICCQLREQEMSVGDIETQLGFKEPRLSRELANLRDEGLVETRRERLRVVGQRLEAARDRLVYPRGHVLATSPWPKTCCDCNRNCKSMRYRWP